MAGFRFSQLAKEFIDNLERSGATVIRTRVTNERPAIFTVITAERKTECHLFLWTISPGGGGQGVRPANERRIQLTGIGGMPLLPGTRTILGGWSEESSVYAFWDARRHVRFSSNSPSLQVDLNTIETASAVGLATQLRPTRDGQHEVVVGVDPNSLLWYVQFGSSLQNADVDSEATKDLVDASPEEEREFIDSGLTPDATARRVDLVETLQSFRDSRFRPSVMQAYRFRCAVCQCDLKLVDAAHIVPVSDPRSTDEVTNGMALCRLHHGAYDNALLGVQSDGTIVVNPNAIERLQDLGLAGGFDAFRERLPTRIHLPSAIEVRPDPRMLTIGLEVRRWPPNLIV